MNNYQNPYEQNPNPNMNQNSNPNYQPSNPYNQ